MNANITQAQEWIAQADAILIGVSNGLSIAEGYHIFANNEMFRRQFGDMQQQYGFRNVVEGLYFQYPTAEARLACIIHRGNFNGYTFLNMLLHMKTNQHSDVSRGLSKKILP